MLRSCYCDTFSFFFFNQKTASEMRISDWSSDVCSSDLPAGKWHTFDMASALVEEISAEDIFPTSIETFADQLDFLRELLFIVTESRLERAGRIAADIGAKSRVQLSIGRDGLQLHVAGQIIFQLPVETPVFDDIEVRARSIGQVRVDATVRVSNDKAIIIGQMLTCLARQ